MGFIEKKRKTMFRIAMLFSIFCVLTCTAFTGTAMADELSIKALFQQADDARKAHDYDKAIGLYDRIIKREPDNAKVWYYLADSYDSQEKLDQAEKAYRQAISLAPHNANVYGGLGWLLIKQGRLKAAKSPTLKAIKLDPYSISWIINLGHIYLFEGNKEQAKKQYLEGLALINDEENYTQGIVADFKLFIKKGWHVDACKQMLIWEEKQNHRFHKARQLYQQGSQSYKAKEYQEAIDAYQASMDEYRSIVDNKSARITKIRMKVTDVYFVWGESLHNMAGLYYKMGSYMKAIPLLKQLLSIQKKTLGNKNHSYIQTREEVAGLYFNWGISLNKDKKYKASIKVFTQAQAIDEGLSPLAYGYAYGWIAKCYKSLNQYHAALKYRLKHVAVMKQQKGEDDPLYAQSLNNLAGLYASMGEYGKALPLYQQALEINKKSLGKEDPLYAISLNNLALYYKNMGSYEKALPLYEQALAIEKKVFGEDSSDYAIHLNNLAELYQAMGLYGKALPLLKQALVIDKKVFGTNHPNYAMILNNLAELYKIMGLYTKALPLLKKALVIDKETLSENHPDYAMCLHNIAALYSAMGSYTKALAIYEQVLAIKKRTLGENHTNYALTLNSLAGLYELMGSYAKALLFYKQAFEIDKKVLSKYHPRYATDLNNLAGIYLLMGKEDQALPLLQQALLISKSLDNPMILLSSQSWISSVFSKQHQPESAIFFGKQAVNTLQSMRQMQQGLDKSLRKSFLKNHERTYKHLADLLIIQGRLPEAQQVLAMLKEEEFFEFIRRDAKSDPRKTTVGFTPAEQPWLDKYNKIANRVAANGVELRALRKKSLRTAADKKRIKELRSEQKVAMKAFNQTISELQADFAKLKDQRRRIELAKKNISPKKSGMVRELGHDTVLLQYIMMETKLYIMVTTPDAVLARQVAVKAADLNKLIQQFRHALGDPHIDPRPAGKALYAKLIAPVASDLKQAKAKMLMVSLDGALRYIPIAALYDGKSFVAEHYAVAIYTEAAAAKIVTPPKGNWTVAGLGLSQKVKGFNPLPAVAQELNGIVIKGKGDKEGVIPGIVALDQAFTDEALQDALFDEYRVLHIASHFVFKPGTLEKSFLLLGDGSHLTLAQIQQGDYDLSSVELLTLSACETAVGAIGASGNEVEGLGALAQTKGAKAVLATLWSVADESTGKFMQNLYRTKVETPDMTKAEALRQVQLSFISGGQAGRGDTVHRGAAPLQTQLTTGSAYTPDASAPYAHPYYWAPFILMGNWL